MHQLLLDNPEMDFDVEKVSVELCKCLVLGRNQESFSSFAGKPLPETCEQFGLELIYSEPVVDKLPVPQELTTMLETIDNHVNMKNEASARVVIDAITLSALPPTKTKVMFTEYQLRAFINGKEYHGFSDYVFADCIAMPSPKMRGDLLRRGAAYADMATSFITEAKGTSVDVEAACSQVLVTMLAARGPTKNTIYGAATNGEQWIPLVLQGKKLFYLGAFYRRQQLGYILAILVDHLASRSTFLPTSPPRSLPVAGSHAARSHPINPGMVTPVAQTAAVKAAAKAAAKAATKAAAKAVAKRKPTPSSPAAHRKKKNKKNFAPLSPPTTRASHR